MAESSNVIQRLDVVMGANLPEQSKEAVYILENGQVFEDGIVLDADRKLLEDVLVCGHGKCSRDHRLLRIDMEVGSPKLEHYSGKVAVIASRGAENYYHWLFQMITRFAILQESGIQYDKLYFHGLNKEYHKQTLDLLNIDTSLVIFGDEDTLLSADTLIVPSIPVWPVKDKTFAPWVQCYLRDVFLNSPDELLGNEFPKKILISRKKPNLRCIINEEEVMSILSLIGYETIVLEDFPVVEQAIIFANVESVIGVHGSGLSNLVFCKAGTEVIEIDPPDGHRGPYRTLARDCKLEYQNLSTSDIELLTDEKVSESVFVDLAALDRMIKSMSELRKI